jgi:hypothetical protein
MVKTSSAQYMDVIMGNLNAVRHQHFHNYIAQSNLVNAPSAPAVALGGGSAPRDGQARDDDADDDEVDEGRGKNRKRRKKKRV